MKELKNFFLLSLFVVVALPLLISSSQITADHAYNHFSSTSFRLLMAVQKYRKDLKLAHLPLSPSLMSLATTHIEDLKANFANLQKLNCTSPLSWSSVHTGKGKWSPCCLSTQNATQLVDCSVDKAAELLVGYEGLAKEIIVKVSPDTSVETILETFLKNKSFLPIIASSGNYRFVEWKAIGASVDGGFASIWFGNAVDKAKWHNGTGPEPPVPTPEGLLVHCDFLDGLDEGAAIVEMISVFRAQQNFSSIPISPSLMQLARSHVKDLYAKYYTRSGSENSCSELSWFNTTGYGCCVPKGANGEDSLCVHQAPKAVSNYEGDAYEIVYVDKNKDAALEPMEILTQVLKTPVFKAVIFSERLSEGQDFTYVKWLAAGAAVKGGVTSIWIGDTDDLIDCIEDNTTSSHTTTTIATDTTFDPSKDIISEITKEKVSAHVTYHRYDFAEAAYTLAGLVNKYRTSNGATALHPAPSLFALADLHVDDLVKERENLKKKGCSSLLSWSSDVQWEGCCLNSTSKNRNCSLDKPAEVTKDYQGKATEFIIKIAKTQTPEQAFNTLLKRTGFKEKVLDSSVINFGTEFDQGFVSVWLGSGFDSAEWFKKTSPTQAGNVKTR